MTNDLIHAVARIRALEQGLLSVTDIERMLGAKTLSEAFSVLDDFGFSAFVSSDRETMNFEHVLESGLLETKEFFDHLSDSHLLEILFLPADLHNAKLLVKGVRKNISPEETASLLLPYGSISIADLSLALSGKGKHWITPLLQTAQKAESEKDAEFALERGVFREMETRANTSKDPFIKGFVQRLIDIQNIKRFVRGEKDILLGGSFLPKVWASENLEMFVARTSSTHWGSAITDGVGSFEKTGRWTRLEFLLDIELFEYLKVSSRGVIDGFAPLFAYFWRKERNARVIRSILVSHKNGLSEPEIRSAFSHLVF